MRYTNADRQGGDAAVRSPLETLVKGFGMELLELDVFRGKPRRDKSRSGSPGTVQIRAVVYKPGPIGAGGAISIEDCSKAHRAMMPCLEEAFPGLDLSVEVSSPGINRQIRDGLEFACYRGRGVRCWRTDISDWSAGVLEAADGQGITIKGKEGTIRLDYEIIAKARLDPSQEE